MHGNLAKYHLMYNASLHRASSASPRAAGGDSAATTRRSGGRIIPLKTKVEYTSRANPTTWSHLNVSQPRKSEMIQINSVLQVSMVDRDVALTLLVTERPKKLKHLAVSDNDFRIKQGGWLTRY